MRTLLTTIALLLCTIVGAQDIEKSYAEGKALYDAKNYTKALPKLQYAAGKGHKKAQYRLGKCYDKGLGVKENDETAFHWYSEAAKQNHAKSQYEVGKCYKNGEGVAKNRAEAVKYFTLSANQDNAEAQLALGKCYMKGKGVKQDMAKAKSLFQKAVTNKNDGDEVLSDLRKEAAAKDEDAIAILKMVKL